MVLFVVVCMVIIFGYTQIENWINPKPKVLTPQQQADLRNNLPFLVANVPQGDGFDAFRLLALEAERQNLDALKKHATELAKREPPKPKDPPKPKPPEVKPDFLTLGDERFALQVRLTSKGGGVDRVIVTHFPQADENGREVYEKDEAGNDRRGPDGKKISKSLQLIPSTQDLPEEERHSVPHASFLMYHYGKPSEERPENLLGERAWKIVTKPDANSEMQMAVFETELPQFGLKIVKTYELQKANYHIGLKVRIERIPGQIMLPFRYQLSGGHGLPIEGKWYTGVYRNAIFGYVQNGVPTRKLEDARTIHHNSGSEKVHRAEGLRLQYAATAIQYFASALCVDDEANKTDFVEAMRATAEGTTAKNEIMLGEVSPRMISVPLKDVESEEHQYLLYHGPIKVRLLSQLRGDKAVPETLVERYEKKLNLRTMTDYHSDTWIGQFANFIFWTDLVIASTNFMHWIFGALTSFMPPWLAILCLTVLVRGLLMPVSRWQTAKQMRLTEQMAKLNPEIKKLEEQYKGRDAQELNQAKTRLMMEHGINPIAQLGGCLPMIAQMPIFMGLYYCLQENVFFRLESFLWIPNLAAPDMLFYWGNWMKMLGLGIGDTLYLGPYFNLLPAITVTLYILQQKFMMPPAADEQQKFQQGMMKYMMIFVGIMFYKVAAGLCMYFIFSTLWGLAERKLIPKPKPKPLDETKNKGGAKKQKSAFQLWLEKILEEAQKKNR
jgi:YidC/Oxa1 family membrane protein insertase